MNASAASRGRPHTAGVGWRARTSSSTDGAGCDSRPSTRVARCWTFATATTDGSAYEQLGRSGDEPVEVGHEAGGVAEPQPAEHGGDIDGGVGHELDLADQH